MKARKNSAVFGFNTSAGIACQNARTAETPAGATCVGTRTRPAEGFSSTARTPRYTR